MSLTKWELFGKLALNLSKSVSLKTNVIENDNEINNDPHWQREISQMF